MSTVCCTLRTRRLGRLTLLGVVLGAVGAAAMTTGAAQDREMPTGYISGIVESSAGAEAGVWVIAETQDLATKFVKVVVTDDDGRFALPQVDLAQ